MFNIGDKIVYPVQGVGVIDLIEEKEFAGKVQKFYNIHLISNSMKVMLPTNRVEITNIRHISDSKTLDNLFYNSTLDYESLDKIKSLNCKERLQLNTDKIKSGSLKDLMEVVYTLASIKKQHSLNTSESQQLKNSKKMLIDEISLIKDISSLEATDILKNSIKAC